MCGSKRRYTLGIDHTPDSDTGSQQQGDYKEWIAKHILPISFFISGISILTPEIHAKENPGIITDPQDSWTIDTSSFRAFIRFRLPCLSRVPPKAGSKGARA
jgi:hypothetical protein